MDLGYFEMFGFVGWTAYPQHVAGVVLELGFKQALFESCKHK